MVVKFLNRPVPVIAKPAVQEYTILNALAEWVNKPTSDVLMLVHKETGVGYRVMGFDPQTYRVKLKGSQGELLNPVVTEREAALYNPFWR